MMNTDFGTITYVKQCDCKAAAGTNRFVMKTRSIGFTQIATLTFIPGPSCCKCDKAWKVTDEKESSPQNTAPR